MYFNKHIKHKLQTYMSECEHIIHEPDWMCDIADWQAWLSSTSCPPTITMGQEPLSLLCVASLSLPLQVRVQSHGENHVESTYLQHFHNSSKIKADKRQKESNLETHWNRTERKKHIELCMEIQAVSKHFSCVLHAGNFIRISKMTSNEYIATLIIISTGLRKFWFYKSLTFSHVWGHVTWPVAGCGDPASSQPQYHIPVFRRLCWCCLPRSSLHILGCKLPEEDSTHQSTVSQSPNTLRMYSAKELGSK